MRQLRCLHIRNPANLAHGEVFGGTPKANGRIVGVDQDADAHKVMLLLTKCVHKREHLPFVGG